MPQNNTKASTSKSRPSRKRDFVYEAAPLIEVIVEVHWELLKLPSLGGAIDPVFSDFVGKFRAAVKKHGFVYEEDLMPPGVPLEFLADQPTKRFRLKEKVWPLFQIGPGVFTINIIPPYQGWENFLPTIRLGLNALYSTHQGIKNSVKITRLDLRYINGFDKNFGLKHRGKFIEDALHLAVPIPRGFKKIVKKGGANVGHEGRLNMLLNEPTGAGGVVSWKNGKINDRPAVIMEIIVRTADKPAPQKTKSIITWLNKSHEVIHQWFHSIVSADTLKLFGKRVNL